MTTEPRKILWLPWKQAAHPLIECNNVSGFQSSVESLTRSITERQRLRSFGPRAIACRRKRSPFCWYWLDGMLAMSRVNPSCLLRICHPDEQIGWQDAGALIRYMDQPTLVGHYDGDPKSDMIEMVPDLSDPATSFLLIRLVRWEFGPNCHTETNGTQWRVNLGHDRPPMPWVGCEVEALVCALEEAKRLNP